MAVTAGIMNFDFSTTTTGLHEFPGVRWRAASMNFVFVCAVIGGSWGSSQTSGTPNSVTAIEDTSTQSSYANAHSYVEQPSQQLVKLIPELKHLQPAPDQQALPEILHKTGLRVNDFFSNIVDLVAHEKITQA